ncbi:major facilitator superfamily domain-containing protein [Scleroderma citrinum]
MSLSGTLQEVFTEEAGLAVIGATAGHPTLRPEAHSEAERQLKQKLDSRLMPTLVAICLMNYIDRAAITSARLQGLQTDLHLTDVQYDTVIAILYASYCPAQIPSNMLLNYITRPSFYISTCVILWGITSALTGITKNFTDILACRIFLGLPEAAFYPGCMYLLSRWYTRKELGLRAAILYAGLLISYAFGSLWAAAILGTMDGTVGIAAWRWLFYIEGAVTVSIGFLSMWLLPDYPDNTAWLSVEERHLAQLRLADDVGEADADPQEASLFEGFVMAIKDPKVYLFILLNSCEILAMSFSNFFPTLTATLGYSTTVTLLMAAPPWILPAIVGLINAWHAGQSGERFFHLAIWWWMTIIGYVISLTTMLTAARYCSLFLMAIGYSGMSCNMLTVVWVANSIPRPPAKRSVAIALVNGIAGIGNVVGSYIWKASWGPQYVTSMLIALTAATSASVLAFVIRWVLIRENRRMELQELRILQGAQHERIEKAAELGGVSFEEALRRRKGFRYLY